MKNKKGITPIFLIVIIALVLVALYVLLFLPIPAFTKIRTIINYIIIIIAWVILQIGIILGYYYLGKYAMKGFKIYQNKFRNIVLGIKRFLVMRY